MFKILGTWKAEIGRIAVEASCSKKFVRSPSQQKKPGYGGTGLSSQKQQEV
jgi:hypothetical protein